ncbi:MAG TPA: NUDIX domain-containing protein [Feifaniaceae bacterium]|nr:NUDIX domain-containing protein [Feifaniaceae bacterium]
MSVRSTAKAIILHNGKVLLNKCYDKHNGGYYSLPGGGQNQYEPLEEAAVRECLEETGYAVTPVRFAALYEEICLDEEIRAVYPQYAHKLYHIFVCTLKNEERSAPTETDDLQLGAVWVDIAALSSVRLLPRAVGARMAELIAGAPPLFLGTDHIPFNHG